MQLQYSLPGVTVDTQDLEKLWAELAPMFAGVDQAVVVEDRAEVTITAGRGASRRTIQDSDIKRLLEGVFLRGVVRDIDIYFELTTLEPDGQDTQSLMISLSRDDTTLVQLEGTIEWVHRAKSQVDSFLQQRQNSNAKYRPIAFLAALLPAATIISIPFYRFLIVNSVYTFPVTGILSGFLGLAVASLLWFVFFPLYPISVFNFGPRTHPRFYYRLAREIIVGVVVSLVATAIISVIFFFKP